MEDLPALVFGGVGIPVVGDEGESIILGKSSGGVVLGDVVAV